MTGWRGKRVFITGITGFKGGWLALWLLRAGAEVTGFSLAPPTTPSLFERSKLADRARTILGDVRDLPELSRALETAVPDVVFHMAAQALVRQSYADPVETYSTNVMGSVNLYEALRRLGRPCAVISVTSDKCYENRELERGYREDEPMGGRDPYSSSKGCAELVTAAYRQSFFGGSQTQACGVRLASVRAGNVVGGGDWAQDRLVPDCVRAVESGHAVVLRYPASTRPWQHVLDVLNGYLLLAQRLMSAENAGAWASAWNFGPGAESRRPVSWIVERVLAGYGCGLGWRRADEKVPHEAALLHLDSSKARSALGWSPRLSMEQAIDWTVDWYRRHAAGEEAFDLVVEQIGRFEAEGR